MKKLVKFTGILAVAILAAAQAHATLLLTEPFTYTDGDIVAGSSLNVYGTPNPTSPGPWTSYSGSTALNVASGKAIDSQLNSMDDNVGLGGGTYNAGSLLYASFDATWSVLPAGGGSYFALFKDSTTLDIACRVWASSAAVSGATAGDFRIGIANSSSTLEQFVPVDLTLGTTYRIVMRMDETVGTTAVSTVWVNPVTESSPGATALPTDSSFQDNYAFFALRQAGPTSGAGVTAIDNLLVGTTFGDVVVPEPSTVALVVVGVLGMFAIRRRQRS